MLTGYDSLDEYDKALAVGADLGKQYPESRAIFCNQSFDLRAPRRFDEADKLAAERLKRIPGDLAAMRVLVFNAIARGDYVKAHALAQNIIDEGKAEPQDLNMVAWDSLFTGKVEPAISKTPLKARN